MKDGLSRFGADIDQAFTAADSQEEEKIAVRGANASADLMATRPRVALSPARALALRPAQGCGRRLRARLAGGRQAARRPQPASRRAIVAAANAIFVGVGLGKVEYTAHVSFATSSAVREQRGRER